MCGIFGILVNEECGLDPKFIEAAAKKMFLLSESRGKEASGLSILTTDAIRTYKTARPASVLVKNRKYKKLLGDALGKNGGPFAMIGHSRLVTDGNRFVNKNNQPVVSDGIVGIHNGIIVNHNELWEKFPEMNRRTEVDSEVIFSLVKMFLKNGKPANEAVSGTFREIDGMASIAALFEDLDYLLLSTNNGSLYQGVAESGAYFFFSSESYILKEFAGTPFVASVAGKIRISQISPGTGRFVNLRDLSAADLSLGSEAPFPTDIKTNSKRRSIQIAASDENDRPDMKCAHPGKHVIRAVKKRFSGHRGFPDGLIRCKKCVLPETMPYIEFDDEGVCNFCGNYQKLEFHGEEALEKAVAPYRSNNGEPDCIVGVSGGRDSIYCLHYVKNVLKMNPLAYTYDWGMVTDLARRNISRICGRLGIEHILISADITKKRKYINKNVSAWLKRPSLGMIPLFMAGDKQYFYYAQYLKKRTGVKLLILGENMLEKTNFKTGFAGVKPFYNDANHVYTLSPAGKLRLLHFYGNQYLKNPSYINASLFDTMIAFCCYYFLDRSYINLYKYIPWEEEKIIPTIREKYDWELATDTKSTWRIGDGTSAFYNYIYMTVAGFSENDTFRSNQIREGLITREQALRLAEEDNKPRFESIAWYLDTIGLEHDIESVLDIIERIPKIYGAC